MAQPTEPLLHPALPAELRDALKTFDAEDQAYFLLEFLEQIAPEAADWREISRPAETIIAGFSNRLAELLAGLSVHARAARVASFLDELDQEQRWDALVASPESQAYLKDAAEAAIERHIRKAN